MIHPPLLVLELSTVIKTDISLANVVYIAFAESEKPYTANFIATSRVPFTEFNLFEAELAVCQNLSLFFFSFFLLILVQSTFDNLKLLYDSGNCLAC